MPYKTISRDMKKRALEMIEEGWTAEEVADVLHVLWTHPMAVEAVLDCLQPRSERIYTNSSRRV